VGESKPNSELVATVREALEHLYHFTPDEQPARYGRSEAVTQAFAALSSLEEQYENLRANLRTCPYCAHTVEWQDDDPPEGPCAGCRRSNGLIENEKHPKPTDSPFPQPALETSEKSLWPDREIPGKPADFDPAKEPKA